MPIAVVTEELKSLNEYYLQEVLNYIAYLKFKQDSQQTKDKVSRAEAIKTFNSFIGALPQDFDEEAAKHSYFAEKYGV